MRYSTATWALPCDARRQARTSDSGNPMAVKLATVSGGKESDGVADVVDDVVVVVAGG